MSDDAGFGIIPRRLRGKLNPNEIAVYVALTWRADETGVCWPSHSTLAEDCGSSVSVVQRALKSLHAKQLVTWVTRTNDNGGRTSNGYQVAIFSPLDPSVILTDPLGHIDRPPQSDRPTPPVILTEEVNPLNENQGTTSAQLALVASDGRSTKSKRAVKTALDESWDPMSDDALLTWAKTHEAPSREFVQLHTDEFKDWCRATGTKYIDWKAAWRKWLTKSIADHKRRAPYDRTKPTAKSFPGQGMFK